MITRRSFLKGAAGAVVTGYAAACTRAADDAVRWDASAYKKSDRSRVAVLAAAYDERLAERLREGIDLFGLDVDGKSVVLKPNLVEYDPEGVINTHPGLIAAAIEVFRNMGARRVTVAEGPGHRRDNEYLLSASGLFEVLREFDTGYVDLNYDVSRRISLASSFTSMGSLYLPDTVLDADLLVSMPKLKTHHWAGVTLSMKNMFGIVPGSVYGWPKNPLHWAGIHESIVDINASLAMPRFAIVDGIVGMEGNGPIQGRAKASGLLVLGEDPVAVDATATRMMGLDPLQLPYLAKAARFMGNSERSRIEQIGEAPEELTQDYEVLDSFRALKEFSG